MTAPPQPFVVPVPQISWIMGPPPFITLSDIYDVPGTDMFEVSCITDGYCMLKLSWERTNPPPSPGQLPLVGSVSDVGPNINHRLKVPAGSLVQPPRLETPQEVRFEISLDPSDTSGRKLRPYIGTLKLRQKPWNFVPVRFYNFGDTPPPPAGGDEGDWNTYAWAQYNPNGQPLAHLSLAWLDLAATNGTETFPVARVTSRYVEPTGTEISVRMYSPVPDVANAIPTPANPQQTAIFETFLSGALRERFTWHVPAPGELEAVETIIRVTAPSQLVRIARLVKNPGPTPTFMGANYWLIDQALANLKAPPPPP